MFRNPAPTSTVASGTLLRRALARTLLLASGLVAVCSAAGSAAAQSLATQASAGEQDALGDAVLQSLQGWTRDHAQAGVPAGQGAARVEVELGRLDPRLRLAPCVRIEPYLPANSRPWGRTRVGLRCVDGPTRWNVFLPVQVKVFAPATVLNTSLPVGAEVSVEHLTEAEVDWADGRQPPVTEAAALVGRRLTRAVSAGEPLRASDLQRPVWFQAGDAVKIVALGRGFEVSGEGQALARGVDGQSVRVRTPAGRVITGTAVAERRVELPL
ncbi:MAG: flagellar basal body P-ring formation protein FlgA [Burkholderiaceae bacterium]|nr:flagellar basal body P-ring formation protein FlgA [Burkholderiaceae bacterium]